MESHKERAFQILIKELEISRKEIESANKSLSFLFSKLFVILFSSTISIIILLFKGFHIEILSKNTSKMLLFIVYLILLLLIAFSILYSIGLYSFILARVEYEVFKLKPQLQSLIDEKIRILEWNIYSSNYKNLVSSILNTIIGLVYITYISFFLAGIILMVKLKLQNIVILILFLINLLLLIINFIFLGMFLNKRRILKNKFFYSPKCL
jgi:hypothetical protein